VGDVTHGACTFRSVSILQPGHRIELAHQTAGSTDPAGTGGAALPIGQIESRSIAAAAFFGHSGFDGTVRASLLARVDDAGDGRGDPLWPELVALAFASQMALLDISDGLAMQIALSLGGIVAMIATATLLNLISIKPRQKS
jgi:hypothetical protein